MGDGQIKQTDNAESSRETFVQKDSRVDSSRVERLNVQTRAGEKAAEYIQGVESSEIASEVSEVMQSGKEGEKGSMAGAGAGGKKFTPAQIKAQLLQRAPSEEAMKAQIGREIKKEIKYLHKRARKILRGPGSFNAFELNNVVKKVRELKSILINLAKAAIQTIKTLWLRFVHGVM